MSFPTRAHELTPHHRFAFIFPIGKLRTHITTSRNQSLLDPITRDHVDVVAHAVEGIKYARLPRNQHGNRGVCHIPLHLHRHSDSSGGMARDHLVSKGSRARERR